MNKLFKLASLGLLALGFNALNNSLFAQSPLVVSYTVSGHSGDYTLDFTVNNASPGTGNQDIVDFGVYDPTASVSSAPSPFANISSDYPAGLSLYSYIYAGTTLSYNDIWFDVTSFYLLPGTIVSGFNVLDTGAKAPTSIPYFAIGTDPYGFSYTGTGNLIAGDPDNETAFEGNANAVPEAGSTMPLLGLALGALGGISRRFRKA